MRVVALTLYFLSVLGLSGCASNPQITEQQFEAIDSIRVVTKQAVTPFVVEYEERDSTPAVASSGMIGILIASAMDAPGNNSRQYDSYIKAGAFNKLAGTINTSADLQQRLNQKLQTMGFSAASSNSMSLKLHVTNQLSEDTKTLAVETSYEIIDFAYRELHRNATSVQYTVKENWSRDKLLRALTAAVTETTDLIALDIAGNIPTTTPKNTRSVRGKIKSYIETIHLGMSENKLYNRFRLRNNSLYSVVSEDGEVAIRRFLSCSTSCTK